MSPARNCFTGDKIFDRASDCAYKMFLDVYETKTFGELRLKAYCRRFIEQ